MNRYPSSISWNPTVSSGDGNPPEEYDEATDGVEPHQSLLARHRNFFLPLHYTRSYRYPLIIWLHNSGYCETQIDDVMPFVSLRNFIGLGIRGTAAVDSAGHGYQWRESSAGVAASERAVTEAIEEAIARYSVHPERIVLAGYRDGGTMAIRLAMRAPQRFAAAISLAGRMPQGAIRNINELRQRRLPMLWQWGRENPCFSLENLKADCRVAMTMGAKVEIRQYPGDDEMDTVVLSDLNEWIMRCVVQGSAVGADDRWASSPTSYSSN